ncbi:hypothetical protein LTR95_016104 [Oleoguttula sp. CCFEE 5521]
MSTIESHNGRDIEMHGLSHTMKLSLVHDAMATGNIAPTSMGRLRNITKVAAKLSTIRRSFLKCIIQDVGSVKPSRPNALQGREKADATSFHDQPSIANGETGTESSPVSPFCKSSTPGKGCQLPALKYERMLPALHWDALYCTVTAEVKFLYNDLRSRCGHSDGEPGAHVLHGFGTGEGMKYDMCVAKFAAMLERFWYDLVDSTVVAAIDYHVKQKNAFAELGRVPKMVKILAADGIINIDGATSDHIWHMLEVAFAPALTQAAFHDNIKEDAYLISPRSAMRRYEPLIKYGLDPDYLKCSCPAGCLAISHLHMIYDRSISAGIVRAKVAAFERPNLQLAIPAPVEAEEITPEDEEEMAEAYRVCGVHLEFTVRGGPQGA